MASASFAWFSSSPSMLLDGFQRLGGVAEDVADVPLGVFIEDVLDPLGGGCRVACWPPSTPCRCPLTVSIGSARARFKPVGSSETWPFEDRAGAMGLPATALPGVGNESQRRVAQQVARDVAVLVLVDGLVGLDLRRHQDLRVLVGQLDVG